MFWVGLSLGKVIGIAAVGLIVLIAACLGCHKPTFSLVHVEATKPQSHGATKGQEKSQEGDPLEEDPRWERLEK